MRAYGQLYRRFRSRSAPGSMLSVSELASVTISAVREVEGWMLLLVLAASTASCLGQSTATTSVISQPAIKDFQPLGKPPELNPVEPIKEFEPLGKTPALKPVEPLVDWLPIWGKSARE